MNPTSELGGLRPSLREKEVGTEMEEGVPGQGKLPFPIRTPLEAEDFPPHRRTRELYRSCSGFSFLPGELSWLSGRLSHLHDPTTFLLFEFQLQDRLALACQFGDGVAREGVDDPLQG